MSTVVIAMSGGVDSSVAGALLKEQGHNVIGITMQIWQENTSATKGSGCCSLGAVEDARRVCAKIGIPHYVLNYKENFADKVINNFIDEYKRGRTPNPCVNCNRFVKFDQLLLNAKQFGADYLATGHYARIEHDEARDRWLLKKALNEAKDQSYVLSYFTQEQLASTIMPLGEMVSKDETRQIAKDLGLLVANKPDSQEICFTHGKSYTEFLKAKAPETGVPGAIVDTSGKLLGQHEGIANYTIGQRKRINVGAAIPLFVVNIDPNTNNVMVGSEDDLKASELFATDMNWVGARGVDDITHEVSVKIRSTTPAKAATVSGSNETVKVTFSEPERAVTPGQTAVIYDGDIVLAAGTIV